MSVFSKVYEDMMSKVKTSETIQNFNTEYLLKTMFYSTVISSFEWGGKDFPKFIEQNPDYIEENFIGSPITGGYISPRTGSFTLAPCFGSGKLLNNGLYSTYTCIYRNGEQDIIKYEDIELCFNNSLHQPNAPIIEEFIQKCLRALRTVDISLIRAGLPSVLACNDEIKINSIIDSMVESYNQNKPFHMVSGDWVDNTIKDIPLYDDKATNIMGQWDIFVRYKNLFYSTFGINNVEVVKAERLTKNESESNTEIVRYTLFNDMFTHRKSFVERCKKHFNVDITVDINRNFDTVTELNMTTEEKVEMKKMYIAPYSEDINEKEDKDNDINKD